MKGREALQLRAEYPGPGRYAVNCPILLRALENAKMRRWDCYVEGTRGRIRGVPLGLGRIHPECGDPSDQSVPADLVVRQEPDEEEDDDGTKDDDRDDGYSE